VVPKRSIIIDLADANVNGNWSSLDWFE
jgi:hypothetical protein